MICTLFKNILCIHHLRFLQSVRFHGNLNLITAKRTYLAVFFWYKCNNPIGFGEIFTDFSFVILHSFWYWFMFNAPYAPSLWRITTSGSTQMHLPSKSPCTNVQYSRAAHEQLAQRIQNSTISKFESSVYLIYRLQSRARYTVKHIYLTVYLRDYDIQIAHTNILYNRKTPHLVRSGAKIYRFLIAAKQINNYLLYAA